MRLIDADALKEISIHPPRGGWDDSMPVSVGAGNDFNPPTPWGVGPPWSATRRTTISFQSTHPVGGGTGVVTFRYTK